MNKRESNTRMHPSNIKFQLEECHKDCYGWAVHCCYEDRELAYEILQTAYLKILERGNTFAGKSDFKTWAFAIIKNTAIDARRQSRKEAMIISQEENVPDVHFEEGIGSDSEEMDRDSFSEALSRLSERQRQIMELVFYHDLSLNEAAGVLNLSQGSVRKYYDRAKKTLTMWFQKRGIVKI